MPIFNLHKNFDSNFNSDNKNFSQTIEENDLDYLTKISKSMYINSIKYNISIDINSIYRMNKEGQYIQSIFNNNYLDENIKTNLIHHNEIYTKKQIDKLIEIIDLFDEMEHNDITANSHILYKYESEQIINALQWYKYNNISI